MPASEQWKSWNPIVQIRVPRNFKRDLFKAAATRETSVSALVRVAVRKLLAERT